MFTLDHFPIFLSGFLVSLSLIVAIGPQNSFVLKQGIKGQHVGYICAVCIVSDMLLISVGVFTLDRLTALFPTVAVWAKYFGSVFLTLYGIQHFISAIRPKDTIDIDSHPEGITTTTSAYKTILVILALTWLNPHVYLDTVLLIGSVATQYGDQKILFALGAFAGTIVFFLSLGYGARLLRPLFINPKSWQILDGIIGGIMIGIAYKIITMDV